MLREVRYSETPGEKAAAFMAAVDRCGRTRDLRLSGILFAAYIGLTLAVLIIKDGPARYEAALALTAVVWMLVDQFVQSVKTSVMRGLCAEPPGTASLEESIVRLSPEGVEFATSSRTHWRAWPRIIKVARTSRGVLFRMHPMDALIPARAFADSDAAKGFHREAEALRQQAVPPRALAPRACGPGEAMIEYEPERILSWETAVARGVVAARPTPPLRLFRFLTLPCLLAIEILAFCPDDLPRRFVWGLCVLTLGLMHMLAQRWASTPRNIDVPKAENPMLSTMGRKDRLFLGRDAVERESVDSRSRYPWTDFTSVVERGEFVCLMDEDEVELDVPLKAFASQQARDRFMEVAAERIAANRPPPDA